MDLPLLQVSFSKASGGFDEGAENDIQSGGPGLSINKMKI